jgi:peptidoglycan/LPS O-acetylase OafA/YrhL
MAAQAKGTGRAKGPRGPAKPTARATSQASAQPKKPDVPAPSAQSAAPAQPSPRPVGLRLAAAAQAIEAVGLCVAAVFAAVSTADGKSHQTASGIALTLLAFGTALGLGAIAAGLARGRPWSRTPTAMTQLLVIIAGVALLDGHRPEWGVPALLLAAVCLAGLLTPASLRALNRPPSKTSSGKSQ